MLAPPRQPSPAAPSPRPEVAAARVAGACARRCLLLPRRRALQARAALTAPAPPYLTRAQLRWPQPLQHRRRATAAPTAMDLAPLLGEALAGVVSGDSPPPVDAAATAVAAALSEAPAFLALVASLTDARGACAKDADGALPARARALRASYESGGCMEPSADLAPRFSPAQPHLRRASAARPRSSAAPWRRRLRSTEPRCGCSRPLIALRWRPCTRAAPPRCSARGRPPPRSVTATAPSSWTRRVALRS